MLTALVQSVSEDFQILCIPLERIHGRTCKGSFLKVREAWWGPDESQQLRQDISALHVLLKPMITFGKGRRRRFPAT
jgi:hypothetical protein